MCESYNLFIRLESLSSFSSLVFGFWIKSTKTNFHSEKKVAKLKSTGLVINNEGKLKQPSLVSLLCSSTLSCSMHAKIILQIIMADKPQEAEDQHLKQIFQESFSLHLIYPRQYCMKKVNPAKIGNRQTHNAVFQESIYIASIK